MAPSAIPPGWKTTRVRGAAARPRRARLELLRAPYPGADRATAKRAPGVGALASRSQGAAGAEGRGHHGLGCREQLGGRLQEESGSAEGPQQSFPTCSSGGEFQTLRNHRLPRSPRPPQQQAAARVSLAGPRVGAFGLAATPLGPAFALAAASILLVEAEGGGWVESPRWLAAGKSVLVGFVRSAPRLSLEGEGASSPSRSRRRCRCRSPRLKSVSGGGAAGAAMLAAALPIVGGRK